MNKQELKILIREVMMVNRYDLDTKFKEYIKDTGESGMGNDGYNESR